MKIYQWLFFDREEMFFEHFESRSKDEADRLAWEYFSNYMDIVKNDDEFNSTTAETYEEFISDTNHYVDNIDIAGLEATFVTLIV